MNFAKEKEMVNNKYLFIIFTSDFYKFYYSLNTASTLRACNKEVCIFITGYSCNFIFNDWTAFDKKKSIESIKKNKMSSYEEILDICNELKIDFYYCDTALDLLNSKNKKLINEIKIKPMGLYEVINKFKEDQIIFI